MAILTCENASFSYDGVTVLEDVNFSLKAGDYLCVVGENGSGKSTLIRGLLSLKAPSKGKITLGDGLKKTEIGYLPQQTNIQRDFPASVWEVVLSGCLNSLGGRLSYNREDRERAAANLERMGIEDLRDKSYQALSGGQQQRVLLARALCAADRLLLLDEPVAGLDPMATQELYNLISELNRGGMTILMISHDMNAALRYASHILHVGASSFFGTKDDYLKAGGARRYLRRRGGDRV